MLKKEVTLFINSLTSGGAERVLSVIVTELVSQKISVELFCIEKDHAYEVPKEVKITYLSTLTKEDSSLKKLIYLPYLALKLKKEIKEKNISLIQSHIYRANFINILAKLFGAKHKVEIVEVSSISTLKNGSFAYKINFLLAKILYRYTDFVVFKAQRMKSEFFKNISYKGASQVINNPYNIAKILELSEKEVVDFTFQKDKKYIVTVGRLSAGKRFEKLIEVFQYLEKDVELIIIGEGNEKENLKAKIKEEKLTSRVHLLGKKSNPFQYISQSDIFVLSSEGEGFPNVLVEAMICNVAVISTDCISGPREILAPNSDIDFQLKEDIELAKNGILYPIDDTPSLSKAIHLLLEDTKLRKHYVQQGSIKAKEYALDKTIEKYKNILDV